MRIKEGYIIRKIAGSDIVVPVGENISDFNGIISLNESAAFLWKMLVDESETEQLTEGLMKEYEISRELAEKDAGHFVERLQEAGILE